MPRRAAGILLFRRQADGPSPEVLLVLPRSARGSGSRRGVWSIPKGKPLDSERLIDTARREFEEETARPAPRRLVELGEVVEPTGKRIAVWAADAAWSSSDDLVNGHRPAAEIAEVAWFDAEQAHAMLRPGQTPLLGRIGRLNGRASD